MGKKALPVGKSKIQPMGKRILIAPDEVEIRTTGGLFLPDIFMTGKVQAVGDEVIVFAPGDRVLFHEGRGTKILMMDGEHIILDIEDVLAKVV